MKTTWLASVADWISISFEKLNPALFRLLATILPYNTPLPVAWFTARSAEEFLGFTPIIAFSFVFGLEGMGLWFTSLFVDSIIDWIKSKNWKAFGLPLMFGVVVAVYVYLLVNLNVTLDRINNPNANPALSRVIMLLCFLPLLTGIGNGYYKFKLESRGEQESDKEYNRQAEERDKDRRSNERINKAAFKFGHNPLQQPLVLQQTTPHVQKKKSDWRQLTDREKHEAKHVLSVDDILEKYDIGRATAYAWKTDKYQ